MDKKIYNELVRFAKRIDRNDPYNLVHHCYLKVQGTSFENNIAYIKAIIKNEFFNKKSTYHYNESNHIDYEDNKEKQILYKCIDEVASKSKENEVIKELYIYTIENSILQASREMGINKRTIMALIEDFKQQVLNEFNNYNGDR